MAYDSNTHSNKDGKADEEGGSSAPLGPNNEGGHPKRGGSQNNADHLLLEKLNIEVALDFLARSQLSVYATLTHLSKKHCDKSEQ